MISVNVSGSMHQQLSLLEWEYSTLTIVSTPEMIAVITQNWQLCLLSVLAGIIKGAYYEKRYTVQWDKSIYLFPLVPMRSEEPMIVKKTISYFQI